MSGSISVPAICEQTAGRKGAKSVMLGKILVSSLRNNKLGYVLRTLGFW